ncbi:MAG TPA: hypothetical protein DEQ14_00265 [Treponema sp.]|nr:hypothetical protein [Treponema sp.]
MCPDRQLLSVFFDGELPSPWKEKMESHLAVCPRCRSLLESYRKVSVHALKPAQSVPGGAECLARAQARVWRNLEEKASGKTADFANARFWGRSISIPLPAAAAAVLAVLFAAFWVMRPQDKTTLPNMTLASEEYSIESAGSGGGQGFDSPGMNTAANLNEVLQYLGNRDSGDIILRLPESRNFSSSGQPAIIKAADYSRRRP